MRPIRSAGESFHDFPALTTTFASKTRAMLETSITGANIRLSTMALSVLSENKIENQAKCLTLLGLDGAKELMEMILQVNPNDPENIEGMAAKFYFQQFHPGFVRRNDDPINSVLNYGYAIVRNTIIRDVVCAGFYPAIGIHHKGPFNSFNLADDLIEPWRAMVDLVAHDIVSLQTNLSREQRKQLTLVLHNACMINGEKNTISNGINIMIQSFKNAIEENNADLIKLPDILPVEKIEVISE